MFEQHWLLLVYTIAQPGVLLQKLHLCLPQLLIQLPEPHWHLHCLADWPFETSAGQSCSSKQVAASQAVAETSHPLTGPLAS